MWLYFYLQVTLTHHIAFVLPIPVVCRVYDYDAWINFVQTSSTQEKANRFFIKAERAFSASTGKYARASPWHQRQKKEISPPPSTKPDFHTYRDCCSQLCVSPWQRCQPPQPSSAEWPGGGGRPPQSSPGSQRRPGCHGGGRQGPPDRGSPPGPSPGPGHFHLMNKDCKSANHEQRLQVSQPWTKTASQPTVNKDCKSANHEQWMQVSQPWTMNASRPNISLQYLLSDMAFISREHCV